MLRLFFPWFQKVHAFVAQARREESETNIDEALNFLAYEVLNGDLDRTIALLQRAVDFSARYEQRGGIDDLTEAMVLVRDALLLHPPRHLRQSASLSHLALCLASQYNQLGGVDDLTVAVDLARDALSFYPPGHPGRPEPLCNLAYHLSYRYDQLGRIDDLNEAIELTRDALSLCLPGHPEWPKLLNNLALYLSYRYNQLGGINDLNEGIALTKDALSRCPPGHPQRSVSLNNLALHLSSRYGQLGGINDLDEAIDLTEDALSLCPPGHPQRSMSLSNLSAYLSSRYDQLGRAEDLNEAIVLSQDALSLCPLGHPQRPMSLNNLANHLFSRYDKLGRIDDLNDVIVLARDSLSLCPPGHPQRHKCLSNLANHLFSRYSQLGGVADSNEGVVLSRDALSLCPPGHPQRPMSLNNLAGHLFSRYNRLGGIDDLNEATSLSRDALSLCPPGHPERSTSLNNLACHLFYRYNQLGGMDDLSNVIVLVRYALSLRPPGHPHRFASLNILALHLSSRYDRLGEIDDANEAIDLTRDALSLCPPGHPKRPMSLNNLAVHLFSRYSQVGVIDDLDEAIALGRSALALRPVGHTDWSGFLMNLAGFHYNRFSRLALAEDERVSFSLYAELVRVSQTVSLSDVLAARAWVDKAEKFHHPTTLLAYETTLRLLVEHLTALPSLPQHLAILKSLSSSLAVDAFSACLRNEAPANAVELLEQGRGVFWNQLTRFRSPLDDVIASGPAGKELADQFTRLTSLVRIALDSPGTGQHDRVCNLNLELQEVVFKIRELPGLSRFLLPSLFSDLQFAASDGPVIIVNVSSYGCDVLVVFADKDPVHLPLAVTNEDVQGWSSKLHDLTRLAKRVDMTKEFMTFLRELWDKLVSPIVDVLRATCPPQSHIWWCPTGEFSLLPLHAAAPFRKGQKGVSDLYVSSYTTTLTALIRSRRRTELHSASEKKRLVAIGQAVAKDTSELFSVSTELDSIGQLVGDCAAFARIEGEDACITNVVHELGKNEWVHFACHGIPDQESPFESAFALHDGRFTVQHIIHCDVQNPEFAYLSACHTTVGDKESPDEVIHLASAMQFAGFRSVIGTMWAVDDSETNKITSMFYKFMRDESGRLDYTRAAFALRKTMKMVNVPIDQRILYVHLGA